MDKTVPSEQNCNEFSGPYTVNSNAITIGLLVGTRKPCGADVDAQEQAYLRAL